MRAAEASALVNAARGLLKQGDPVGAARVLSPLIGGLRSDPDALHLMGLIRKAQNNLEDAERFLRAAIAHALTESAYYNDLGVVLQARGAYPEALRVYRAALALNPKADAVRVNIVRCLMAQGEMEEAEREARAYIDASPGAEAWTLLSQVHRAQERHEQALSAARAALDCQPDLRPLKLNYAGALDRAGQPGGALALYEDLAGQALDSQELALAFARALYLAQRKADAEAVLAQALKQWPGAVSLHGAWMRLRLLRGDKEAAADETLAQLNATPDDLALRLACVDALHRAGLNVKALDVLRAGLNRVQDAPQLLTAYGVVLDELDRTHDALWAMRRAADLAPSRVAQRNLLSTLMRARRPDEALSIARSLREQEPDEQYLIACEAQALRMLGESAYARYCDYDRYVRAYEIGPPRGFFTLENFNATLAELLREQHRGVHPFDNDLPHATQTRRSLLTLDRPALKAFLATVDAAVRDYISRLDDDAHDPVGRRRRDRFRFSGLWSTRIAREGHLPNHVHDRGWISSAYYVSVLADERPRDRRHGALKFGEPRRPTPGCAAEKLLEPRVGVLVLFPSYMWHGVTPFEGSERLSLSFDVIPA